MKLFYDVLIRFRGLDTTSRAVFSVVYTETFVRKLSNKLKRVYVVCIRV